MAIASPGAVIEREHLPDDFLDDIVDCEREAAPAAPLIPAAANAQISLDDMTVKAMQLALERNHGNVSATARELGVSRNTLYRKLPASERSK